MACEKCMGLGIGGKIKKLGLIRVLSVRREPLANITQEDVVREGFPDMTRGEFIRFFLSKMKTRLGQLEPVTRIEFEYVEGNL